MKHLLHLLSVGVFLLKNLKDIVTENIQKSKEAQDKRLLLLM